MPSERSYLEFLLDQLSGLRGVTYRPMMGEFLLYFNGKLFGGVYDNRLLVKPTAAARRLMPAAPRELPYEGAKPMLLVEEVDDRLFLAELVSAIAAELPEPNPQKSLQNGKPQSNKK